MDTVKPIIIVVLGLMTSFTFFSCEELGPAINLTGDNKIDTTYVASQVETPQTKVVLLEEFTGVRCPNCPDAHETIEAIEDDNPGRLIAVSLHSEDAFSLPFGYAGEPVVIADEASTFADSWVINAKPSGLVDRIKFDGETSIVINKHEKWINYSQQQFSNSTPVNIHITPEYDEDSSTFEVEVVLHYTSEVLVDNRLSVMILEDNIVTWQDDHGDVDSSYTQNQVLRTMLTDVNGLAINESKEPGRVIVKQFSLKERGFSTIPVGWNADNLRVVAFVHQFVNSKVVSHARESKVKP